MLRGYNETALFAIIEGVIIRTDGRIEGSRDLSGIFGLKRRITLLIVVAAALAGLAYSAQIYGGDGCVQSVSVGWISGTWSGDCVSDRPPDDPDAPLGVRHARFYTFTLDAPSDVTVSLTSEHNPYLYLLAGVGRDGAALHSNNNISANDFNSRIETALPPGNYTIEATTYAVGISGNFTLAFDAVATAAPVSSLTPTLTPTPTSVSGASDYASTLMYNIVAIGEAKLAYRDTQDLCASALEHAYGPERLQEPPEVRRWVLTLLDACEAQHIRNKPTATPTMTPSPTATRAPSYTTPTPNCSDFRPDANLSGCDLRDIDFTGNDLAGANFKGATLTNANFSKATLTNANFKGADIKAARFNGAQMQGADLSGTNVTEAQFRDANLDAAIMTGATIRASRRAHNTQKFRGATLTNITFSSGVNLSGVGFINANLSNSSLVNANLEDADFRNATLRRADLTGANFEGADLGSADLRNMKADNKTTFEKADLAKANLSDVVWSNANFDEADMSGANLTKAEFERGSFNDVNFSDADLEDTDFSNADLDGADFDGAKLDDTDFKDADLTDAKNMENAEDIRNAKWDNTECPDGTNSDDAAYGECYPNHLQPRSN